MKAAQDARLADGTLFMGRLITVQPKRKNIPNMGKRNNIDPMQRMMQMMMRQMRGGRGMYHRGMPRGRGGMRGGGPPGGFRGGQAGP